MREGLSKYMSIADLVTLVGTVMGIAAIFFSLKGELMYAAVLIVLAVLVDAIDGAVARATQRKGNFGVELD